MPDKSRRKAILTGSIIIVFIGLGAVLPIIGWLLGPIFKGIAGLVGGGMAAYLVSSSGRSGARIGSITGLVGGISSGIINFLMNLMGFTVVAGASNPDSAEGARVLAGFGLLTSWIFVLIGAVIGGAIVGWMFGDVRSTDKTEMPS